LSSVFTFIFIIDKTIVFSLNFCYNLTNVLSWRGISYEKEKAVTDSDFAGCAFDSWDRIGNYHS